MAFDVSKLPPQQRDRWAARLTLGVLGLFALVGFGFLADYAGERRLQRRLANDLRAATGVELAGQPVQSSGPLLLALGQIGSIPAHHSGPTEPIPLRILSQRDTIQLTLARDSERPHEFWVFEGQPDPSRSSLGRYAGSVTSADLDAFLRVHGL